MIPDEPGNIVVVVFPDSVFKYASSIRKHLPRLFPAPAENEGEGSAASDQLLDRLRDNARRSPDLVDMGEIDELLERDPLLLDVRTPAEFDEEHVEGAVNLPLEELQSSDGNLPALPQEEKDKLILTVCNVGKISLTAMLLLKSLGYRNVKNLDGGMTAWMSEGYPTEP